MLKWGKHRVIEAMEIKYTPICSTTTLILQKRNSPTIDCQEWLDTYLAKVPAGSVAIPYAAA